MSRRRPPTSTSRDNLIKISACDNHSRPRKLQYRDNYWKCYRQITSNTTKRFPITFALTLILHVVLVNALLTALWADTTTSTAEAPQNSLLQGRQSLSSQSHRALLRNLALQAQISANFVPLIRSPSDDVAKSSVPASCLPGDIFCLPVLVRKSAGRQTSGVACAPRICTVSSKGLSKSDSSGQQPPESLKPFSSSENFAEISNLNDGNLTSLWVSRLPPADSSTGNTTALVLQLVAQFGTGQFQVQQINVHFRGCPPAQIILEALAPPKSKVPLNSTSDYGNEKAAPSTLNSKEQWIPLAYLNQFEFSSSAQNSSQKQQQVTHTLEHRLASNQFDASTSALRLTFIGHRYPAELYSTRSLLQTARTLDLAHLQNGKFFQPGTNASFLQQQIVENFYSQYAIAEFSVYGHCASGFFASDLLDYSNRIILRCLPCDCSVVGAQLPTSDNISFVCDIETGQCPCRTSYFAGRRCDQCADKQNLLNNQCEPIFSRARNGDSLSSALASLDTAGNQTITAYFLPDDNNESRMSVLNSATMNISTLAGRRTAGPHRPISATTPTPFLDTNLTTYDVDVNRPSYEFLAGNLTNSRSIADNSTTSSPVVILTASQLSSLPASVIAAAQNSNTLDTKLTAILILIAITLFLVLLYGIFALVRWAWSRRGSFSPYGGDVDRTSRQHINNWLTQNFGTTRRAQTTTQANIAPLDTPPPAGIRTVPNSVNNRNVLFASSGGGGNVAGLTMERGEAPASLIGTRRYKGSNNGEEYAMDELSSTTPSPPSAGNATVAMMTGVADDDSGLAGIQRNTNRQRRSDAEQQFRQQQHIALASAQLQTDNSTKTTTSVMKTVAIATISSPAAATVPQITRGAFQRSVVESRVMEQHETPVVIDEDVLASDDDKEIGEKRTTTFSSSLTPHGRRASDETDEDGGKPWPTSKSASVVGLKGRKTSAGFSNPAFEPSPHDDDELAQRTNTQHNAQQDEDNEYITFDVRSEESSPEKILQRRHSRQEDVGPSATPSTTGSKVQPQNLPSKSERVFSISNGSTTSEDGGVQPPTKPRQVAPNRRDSDEDNFPTAPNFSVTRGNRQNSTNFVDPFYDTQLSNIFGAQNSTAFGSALSSPEVHKQGRMNGDALHGHDSDEEDDAPPAGKLVRWHANNFERMANNNNFSTEDPRILNAALESELVVKKNIPNGFAKREITTEL